MSESSEPSTVRVVHNDQVLDEALVAPDELSNYLKATASRFRQRPLSLILLQDGEAYETQEIM
jgi:hypothetical protein